MGTLRLDQDTMQFINTQDKVETVEKTSCPNRPLSKAPISQCGGPAKVCLLKEHHSGCILSVVIQRLADTDLRVDENV
jgi:hypothetical protein